MKKYFFVMAFIVFVCTLPLQAQKGKDSKPRHKMLENLKLTDNQKDQIEKLRSAHQLKAIDLRADIEKLRLQIKDEMDNKTIEESKVLSLTKKVNDLQAQLKESAVSMRIKTYNLLDDKQKEIWKESSHQFGDKFFGEAKVKHFRGKVKHRMMDHECPFDED